MALRFGREGFAAVDDPAACIISICVSRGGVDEISSDLHFVVGVDGAVGNGVAEMGEVDFDFGVGPLQRLGEVLDGPGVHARAHVPEHEFAEQLEARVARPRVDGDGEGFFLDVDKAGLLVPCLQLVCDAQGLAECHGSLVRHSCPLEQFIVGRHGAVVAVQLRVHLVRLHVAAGLEVVVALLYDLAKVLEDAERHARVDVVVGLGAVPPLFPADVVDEEVDVGGRSVAGQHCYWGAR